MHGARRRAAAADLKTARKGVGRFTVTVKGVASHAGLDPEAGHSAILEVSHQIQSLFALNDPANGRHGQRRDDRRRPAAERDRARGRRPGRGAGRDRRGRRPGRGRTSAGSSRSTEGVSLEVDGDFRRPPLERTAAQPRCSGSRPRGRRGARDRDRRGARRRRLRRQPREHPHRHARRPRGGRRRGPRGPRARDRRPDAGAGRAARRCSSPPRCGSERADGRRQRRPRRRLRRAARRRSSRARASEWETGDYVVAEMLDTGIGRFAVEPPGGGDRGDRARRPADRRARRPRGDADPRRRLARRRRRSRARDADRRPASSAAAPRRRCRRLRSPRCATSATPRGTASR